MEIPLSTLNFVKWINTKTSSIQNNVRTYKGKYYFMDRDTETGRTRDGGVKDLWDVYVKEMTGG